MFQNDCQAQQHPQNSGTRKAYRARFLVESAIIAPKGLTMLDGAVDRAAMGELQVQLTPQLVMR
jgi:hypothetical protein